MASTSTDRIAGLATALAIKAPVAVATTANITLSAAQTIDGVAVVAGDRVLVKNQTTDTENGIYVVQTGAWTRAKDFDGNSDFIEGTLVIVQSGTVNADTVWRQTDTSTVVIDTTSITFELAEFFAAITGGMKFKFDSSTTGGEDPGDGDFRLNNATISSATQITFSNNSGDSGAPDVSDFIATWDDSTNLALRGTVVITELGSPEVFAVFSVNAALTDGTTYLDVPVAYVTGSGTFTSGSAYAITFYRTGNRGVSGGIQMLWESLTTDTDQGAGKLWLNNATIASATVLYIDDVDNAAGTSINSQVDTWDDSSNTDLRGTITFTKATDPAIFATFNVTGAVTSATTYSKIAVTHVTSAGTFTDGDIINVQFVRAGDIGEGAGIRMAWDTSTDDADQGAGTVWVNNATVSSATVLYLDDVDDAGAASINSWVDSLDDSTNTDLRGTITLTVQTDPTVFAIFNVTGVVTSASTYSKIAVTYVTGAGSFSAADKVTVQFARTGDIGEGAGIRMKWDADTSDADQGAGTVWVNNATVASATVVYLDDVEDAGAASINSWVDSLDDSTATIKGTLTLTKQIDAAVFAIFNVTGAVTSASTYSKVAVTYVTGAGSFSADDKVIVSFARTGDDGGGMANLVEDLTPQLGGFLDTNAKSITFSEGAAVASASDCDIWAGADGNTVHITGTTQIDDFGTPAKAGDFMWVIFDGVLTVADSATITVAGNTNFTTAANDIALVYAETTSAFLFVPFKNSGLPTVIDANLVYDDENQTFSKAQRGSITTITGV